MCQYYNVCTTGPTNPFHGAISFDNIGLAWVAIFLVISLEGWTDVMYFIQVRWLHRMENSISSIVLLLTLGLTFLLELDILCQLDCGELNFVHIKSINDTQPPLGWIILHDQPVSGGYCYTVLRN